eukprot:Nitzschia sp. Nitz4//scaffold116_size91068//60740//62058//NITZ4_004962-RA/size91068-processed-gene-0.44-mRNA-1//1//CDS//3329533590//1045//frame0
MSNLRTRPSQPWEIAGGSLTSHSATLPAPQSSFGVTSGTSSLPSPLHHQTPSPHQHTNLVGAPQEEQRTHQAVLQQGAAEQFQQLVLASVSQAYQQSELQRQPQQQAGTSQTSLAPSVTTDVSQLILNAASTRAATSMHLSQQSDDNVVIVPCRARGMPRDHNVQTAYFVIRDDIKHGEGLQCSHSQCRSRGIRFVYCQVCGIPVAKINFTTRHSHLETSEGKRTSWNKKKPLLRGEENDACDEEQDEEDHGHSSSFRTVHEEQDSGIARLKRSRHSSTEEGGRYHRGNAQLELVSRLLEKRPKTADYTGMKEWLVNIILTTELNGGTRGTVTPTAATELLSEEEDTKYVRDLADDSFNEALRVAERHDVGGGEADGGDGDLVVGPTPDEEDEDREVDRI